MAAAKNQIEILKNQVTSLVSTIDSLNNSMKEKDEEIDRQEEENTKLKKDIEDLNKSLEEKAEELYNVNKVLHETQVELEATQADLEDCSNDLEEMTKKFEDSKLRCGELMRNIEGFIKGECNYIGHREDQIDKTLANFIHQYPEREKMKIMFLRESEGVYQFGQKRVFLKLEKGNSIKVRVGGGYMHIDEFLQQFTEQEISKIERKSVVERWQQKRDTQIIASSQSKNMVETIPVNYPQTPGMPQVPHEGIGGFKKASELASSETPRSKKKRDSLKQSVLTGKSPRPSFMNDSQAPPFINFKSIDQSQITDLSMKKSTKV